MPKTYTAKLGTRPVRINYPAFVEPKAPNNNPNGTKKYSCVVMIPKTDKECLKQIKAKMGEVYENNPTMLGDYDFQSMLRIYDGAKASPSGKKYPEYYKDYWILNANNTRKPQFIDKHGAEILDIGTELYSGVWARLGLTFYPYSNSGNTGIGVSLDIVRKHHDDEPLGGVVSVGDYFTDDDEDEDLDEI